MEQRQLELQALLEELEGTHKVYFQPPANIKMEYPAIKYDLDDEEVVYADNLKYRRTYRWQLTYMSYDAKDAFIDKLSALPYSSFDRRYKDNRLYHTVFNVYF